MSRYHRVNAYTWVKTDKPKEWKEKADEGTFREHISQEKKPKPTVRHDYRSFVRSVFEDRKFISQSELNKLIKEHFGGNATYYRRMMIKLDLISENNKLIKPKN